LRGKERKMKRKAITTTMTILFLASTIMALFPSSVKAKEKVTTFTGTETFGYFLDPGTWTYPEGKVYMRGAIAVDYENCTDLRFNGTCIVVANANWDAEPPYADGIWWGTWTTISSVEGGIWEGTFTGWSYADGSRSFLCVGHGRGLFEGMDFVWTIEYPPPPAPGEWVITLLDPHWPFHEGPPDEVLPSYECKDCGATFATYREFQSHREKVHGAAKYYEVVTPTPTTAREPLPLPTHRCPECGQSFPTLREREAHMNLYHP